MTTDTVKPRSLYDCQLRLPATLRRWREARGYPTAKASYAALEDLTGIPMRTFEHIEAGRGFRYPRLLLLALEL